MRSRSIIRLRDITEKKSNVMKTKFGMQVTGVYVTLRKISDEIKILKDGVNSLGIA